MRVHETEGTGALFCGDVPGGHLNECAHCNHEEEMIGANEMKEYCSNCHDEIVYRPWYEW